MTINKDRTYDVLTPHNGYVTIKGSQITEALKDNGIPVDLPDPETMQDHTWEVIGHHDEIKLKKGMMWSRCVDGRWTPEFVALDRSEVDDDNPRVGFYIEYIPNPVVKLTIAEAEKKLSEVSGLKIKITP
jgi:hypothetical protein